MTITFPRDFPLNGAFTEDSSFSPTYMQSQAITGGGSVNAADLGPVMWRGDFATTVLGRENFGVWAAWLQSLRGGLRLFKGRPPLWRWPIAHPKGFAGVLYLGSQWSGLGNLSVIGASRDVVTINAIPNAITLKPGDFISIPVGARQHLHRVVEGSTSAGNAVVLTVEPIIRPGVVTGIAVRVDTPYCDMVLLGEPKISRKGTRGGSVAFSGMQVLL